MQRTLDVWQIDKKQTFFAEAGTEIDIEWLKHSMTSLKRVDGGN